MKIVKGIAVALVLVICAFIFLSCPRHDKVVDEPTVVESVDTVIVDSTHTVDSVITDTKVETSDF